MNDGLERFLDILHGMEDEGQADMVVGAARERGKIWTDDLERTFIRLYDIEADGQNIDDAADNWMVEADCVSVFGLEAVQ